MAAEWLKIGDFARQVGCTPANIYRYAKAYPEELGPEMVKQGRFTVISPAGQDFIRSQMYPKTLSESASQEQVTKLMAALSAADHKAAELQQQLFVVEGERDKALLEAGQYQRALEASHEAEEAKDAEIQDLRQKHNQQHLALEKAREDALHERQQAEKQQAELEAQLAAEKARNEALMGRGLFARIFNKGV